MIARGKALAFVVSAFPGLADYLTDPDIDVRDLSFWIIEAKKKKIRDRIDSCFAARVGMANSEDYERIMRTMSSELELLEEQTSPVLAVDGWASLRSKSKG